MEGPGQLSAAGTDLAAGPCRLRVSGDRTAASVVAAQLGARHAPAEDPPDLTIEVRDLPRGPRRLFGTGEYAAIEGGLILLRGSGKRPVEVLVPFDRLGRHPTIVAAPGSPPVPLLVPIVNVTALARRILPLHAAAFDLDGLGVLVTGWSRSGKTETLLAFAGQGARYVGDEWVYLHGDGQLTGLQEPMRVWSWHLRQLAGAAPRLPLTTRAAFALLDRATDGASHAAERGPGSLRRLRHLLSEQRNVRLPPQQLLPVTESTQLDVLVLTESHDQPTITVEGIDASSVIHRVAAMLPVERAGLLTAYHAYRYAFPGRRSDLLDTAEALELELLAERLHGRPTLLVRHPYPFPFEAMVDALTPWLDQIRAAADPRGRDTRPGPDGWPGVSVRAEAQG